MAIVKTRRGFIILLTAAAFVTRVALGMNSGYWRDEGLFLGVVGLPTWSAMLDFLRFNESHPPLFYIVMRFWISMAGDNQLMITIIPALFGALTVPAMYWIGRKVFNPAVGVTAAVFAAISAHLTLYSSLARPYSLLPLLVLISTYFLFKAAVDNAPRYWLAYALATLAMLFTHNWPWLVFAAQFLALAVVAGRSDNRWRIILAAIVTFAAIGLIYSPWLPTLLDQSRYAGYGPMFLDKATQLVQILLFLLLLLLQMLVSPYVDREFSPFIQWVFIAACLVASFGVYQSTRRAETSSPRATLASPQRARRESLVFLLVPVFSITFAFILSPMTYLLVERCVVMVIPTLVLSLIARLVGLARRFRNKPGGFAMIFAAALVLFTSQVFGSASLFMRSRSNARELAATVANSASPRDLVIIAPVWLASSFNYYFNQPNAQFDFPDGGRHVAVSFFHLWDRFADEKPMRLLERDIAEARTQGRNVWLITDSENLQLSLRDTRIASLNGRLGPMSRVRVRQIRNELESKYGKEQARFVAKKPAPREEQLVAFLYRAQ